MLTISFDDINVLLLSTFQQTAWKLARWFDASLL